MFTSIMSSPSTRSAVALPSSVWRRHTKPGAASARAFTGSGSSMKSASWDESGCASTRATFSWASQQVGEGGVRAVEEAEEVHVHHLFPLLEGRTDGGAEQHHPGVVHEDVEPPKLGDGALDGGGGLGLIGDVGGDDESLPAVASYPL